MVAGTDDSLTWPLHDPTNMKIPIQCEFGMKGDSFAYHWHEVNSQKQNQVC